MLFNKLLLALTYLLTTISALSFVDSVEVHLAFNASTAVASSSTYFFNDTPTIRIPTNSSLSITFPAKPCKSDSADDVVYDSSGTPPWMTFDSDQLIFHGHTPAVTGNSTASLICTEGSDTVSQSFVVLVQEQLRIVTPLPTFTASLRNEFRYDMTGFLGDIQIDSTPLYDKTGSIDHLFIASTVDWLIWNSTTRMLTGTAPDSYISLKNPESLIVPITFSLPDVLPAIANTTLTILPYLFTSLVLPDALVSGDFNLPFQPFLRSPNNTTMTVSLDPRNASQWMCLNSTDLELSGTVPSDLPYQAVSVTFLATDGISNATSTFKVIIQSTEPTSHPFPVTLILVILAAILASLLLLMLGAFAFLRLKRAKKEVLKGKDDDGTPVRSTGSEVIDIKAGPESDLDEGKLSIGASTGIPEPPPMSDTSIQSRTASEMKLGASGYFLSPSASSSYNIKESDSWLTQSKIDTISLELAEIWGVPPPRPPPGASPEEVRRWVDDYVSKWAGSYNQSRGPRSRSRGLSFGGQRIKGSASLPGLVTSGSVGPGPSDTEVSSVASWESLDSWEVERRENYQSPRRRGDFVHRDEREITAAMQVALANGTFGRSPTKRKARRVPLDLEGRDAGGMASSAVKKGKAVERSPELVVGGSASTAIINDGEPDGGVDPYAYFQDYAVFFARPMGAEKPGAGMARSPHLEDLKQWVGQRNDL